MKIIYRGLLCYASNGEEDALLGLMGDDYKVKILAKEVKDNLHYGYNLTVRYFVTDSPVPPDDIEIELIKTMSGYGNIKYNMRYSDITGYLWTDEDLNVGGHNLLYELSSNIGKWLHLEVDYQK